MELRTVWVSYRSGSATAQRLAHRCGEQLQHRGTAVTVVESGLRHNPFPALLAEEQPADLMLVLGGDGTALAAARHMAPTTFRSSASTWVATWVF